MSCTYVRNIRKNECADLKKVVASSEYEHKDRHLKEKWEAIFKNYEIKDKPKHKRGSVVDKLLSDETFQRVATILNLEDKNVRYREEEERLSLESAIGIQPELSVCEEESIYKEKEESDGFSETDAESDLEVHPPTVRDEKTEAKEVNTYLKFLKKSENRAASWRPKDVFIIPPGRTIVGAAPLLVDPHRTLKEKAHTITSAIIKDFCDWFKDLGGVEQPTMTEPTLHHLFEIGFDAPAAKALCVKARELPVVTEAVANARNLPQASVRAGLHREILWDIRVEKMKSNLVGFGTALPPPLRFKAPNNNTKERWLDCPSIPEDVATMKVVWEGITNIRSTRSFCQYLKEHPEIPEPEFLRQVGMVSS